MYNRLERMIAGISSTWATRRLIGRHNLAVLNQILPGYKGGQQSRRRGMVGSTAGSEDSLGGSQYANMIAAAMNLYRNDPLTRSTVDTVATYTGESRPTATTGDKDFDAEATAYFNDDWWGRADARRRPGCDFGMLQYLWGKYIDVGGDMLFALHDDALMPYEGIQIATPGDLHGDKQVVNGIRTQKAAPNRITHYYVRQPTAGNPFTSTTKDFHRFRASQAIFAPSQYWRPSMLRGVPSLHAVIDAMQDWDETNNNVQGKIKFDSKLFTVARKDALGTGPGSRIMNRDTSKGTQVEYRNADWGAHFEVNGDIDKHFQLSEMKNPGSQHVPYMEFMAKVIAAGYGIPYEIVMHIYHASYSASRAARIDFRTFVLGRWRWRHKVLNQRVYNWVIARAIKHGQLRPAPLDDRGRSLWWKSSWTLPHFPQIDEGKEAVAAQRRWQMADKSLDDLAAEQGKTRGQLLDAHDADIDAMQERADARGMTLAEYAPGLFATQEQAAGSEGGKKTEGDGDGE